MNNEAVTFINWMVLFLMVPGGIAITWQVVRDLRLNKALPSTTIVLILLYFVVALSVAGLNMRSEGWLRWSIVLVQLVLATVLLKMAWSPFVRKLRGLD
jgi:hypothetical protein